MTAWSSFHGYPDDMYGNEHGTGAAAADVPRMAEELSTAREAISRALLSERSRYRSLELNVAQAAVDRALALCRPEEGGLPYADHGTAP